MDAAAEVSDVSDRRNITPFDEIVLEIEDLYGEAKNWADGTPIETQAQCDDLDRIDKALLDAGKRLNELRVAEKAPLDKQIDAIQDRYNPFIQPKKGKVDVARSTLNPIRAAFKDAERRRKEAIAEQARKEAEQVARKAQEAMKASAGNLEAREAAERDLEDARIAQDDAKRTAKQAAAGLGLRTSYRAEITDFAAAARFFWKPHHHRFVQLVQEIADEQARVVKADMPGIKVHVEKKAL
jgi:hypothetical protein